MIPAVASPAALSRSTTTTLAPLLAKATAVARPMPFPAPVISATLPAKSRSMAFSPALVPGGELACPLLEGGEHVADETARSLVGEAAVGVELGVSNADQHFGFVDRVHVEKDTAFTQIVLRPRGASHTGTGSHHRHRLAGERLIGRPRGPVDRILKHP